MVIAEVRHGLGNQLFQYAFALAVSERLGQELFLDVSWFRDGKRELEISNYGISGKPLTGWRSGVMRLYARYVKKLSSIGLGRILRRVTGIQFMDESDHPAPFDGLTGRHVFLRGFWQDSSWPELVEDRLRRELRARFRFSDRAAQWIRYFQSRPVIGLHIRRGDYLYARHREIYPELGNSFYRSALAALGPAVVNWPIAVFTDDPDWVERNFDPGRAFELVSGSSEISDIEEFEILRRASAIVTTASTYGWWAAYLSEVPRRLVAAPSCWNLKQPGLATKLVPSGWRIIPIRGSG